MFGPSKETVERLRKQYPAGTRVELTHMSDPWQGKLKEGCLGTVTCVDDIGTYGQLTIMESNLPKSMGDKLF